MKIENQTVHVKGSGHPDSVAHYLSQVALNEIESFNDEIYVNVDASTIKAGRIPELNLSGYMCFDFNKYEIDYRYKLETKVSERLYSTFRNLFPFAKLDVKFNFALYPDSRKKLISEGLHDTTASITTFYPYTDLELKTLELSRYLDDLHYVGKDFKIISTSEEFYINQCFFVNNISLKERLKKDINNNFNLPEIIINPDQPHSGVLYHNFGSKLFDTSSGVASNWNGSEGFYSPQRPRNETYIGGKNNQSSAYLMYKKAKEVAKNKYDSDEEPTVATATCIIGTPRDKYKLTVQ